MLSIIFFTAVLIFGFYLVESLANKGYLNDKQYRIYFIVIFIGFLFLCGQIERECNKPNKYNTNQIK